MTDPTALKAANAKRWSNAKLTRNFSSVAAHLVAPSAKARYQAVEKFTGVPWYFIAVAHEREASQNWNTQLGQGDPLDRVSVHVPAGRGPFKTWEGGAIDALVNCRPYAARNKDWSIGALLTMLEQYNGLGYASGPVTKKNGVIIAQYPPQASPYMWSGTDQYKSGKYVADHVFSPTVIDAQLGCAGLLIGMAAIDRTISFDGKMPPIVILPSTPHPLPPDVPKPEAPSITNPARGSIGAFIASVLSAIFKRE
jgi:lysozyme family protein